MEAALRFSSLRINNCSQRYRRATENPCWRWARRFMSASISNTNITHFYFHDAHRINLLRVHQPERFGDLISRHTALKAEKSAAMFSGIELGPLGTFTLRSVLPVFNDGKLMVISNWDRRSTGCFRMRATCSMLNSLAGRQA